MSGLYFGGMSTDPELRLLDEKFSAIKEGDLLTHEDIEGVTGISRKAARYTTIICRYKKRLLKAKNLHLISEFKVGYHVLTAAERVERNIEDASRGFKIVRRSSERLRNVPREKLDAQTAAKAECAQTIFAKLSNDFSTKKSEIAMPGFSREGSPMLQPNG